MAKQKKLNGFQKKQQQQKQKSNVSITDIIESMAKNIVVINPETGYCAQTYPIVETTARQVANNLQPTKSLVDAVIQQRQTFEQMLTQKFNVNYIDGLAASQQDMNQEYASKNVPQVYQVASGIFDMLVGLLVQKLGTYQAGNGIIFNHIAS